MATIFPLTDPVRTIGVLADFVGSRIQRQVRPERVAQAHPELSDHADDVSDQVKRLAEISEKLLREHRVSRM